MSTYILTSYFHQRSVHNLDLHSFPTRRSSDLFVNKMDRAGANPERVLDEISTRLTPAAMPIASPDDVAFARQDRKSTRLNSSHMSISYAVFCLKKKTKRAYIETHGDRMIGRGS